METGKIIFPGKIARIDCHFLLLRIFPTQGLNPGTELSDLAMSSILQMLIFTTEPPGKPIDIEEILLIMKTFVKK